MVSITLDYLSHKTFGDKEETFRSLVNYINKLLNKEIINTFIISTLLYIRKINLLKHMSQYINIEIDRIKHI